MKRNKELHTRDDVGRLYDTRNGRIGFANIEKCVKSGAHKICQPEQRNMNYCN